jgi:hypothetical protein
MCLSNYITLSEEEYEEYLFLRFYVQNWKLKKLLRQKDKIRNIIESCKLNPENRIKYDTLLGEIKLKIHKEAREVRIRKAQLSNFEKPN